MIESVVVSGITIHALFSLDIKSSLVFHKQGKIGRVETKGIVLNKPVTAVRPSVEMRRINDQIHDLGLAVKDQSTACIVPDRAAVEVKISMKCQLTAVGNGKDFFIGIKTVLALNTGNPQIVLQVLFVSIIFSAKFINFAGDGSIDIVHVICNKGPGRHKRHSTAGNIKGKCISCCVS